MLCTSVGVRGPWSARPTMNAMPVLVGTPLACGASLVLTWTPRLGMNGGSPRGRRARPARRGGHGLVRGRWRPLRRQGRAGDGDAGRRGLRRRRVGRRGRVFGRGRVGRAGLVGGDLVDL